MSVISKQTRKLSLEEVKTKGQTKHRQILEVIGNKEMTAREIENEMCKKKYSEYFDMNHVRPRLTELVNEYYELVECGTKKDFLTHKKVVVYRKATGLEKMMLENANHYTID